LIATLLSVACTAPRPYETDPTWPPTQLLLLGEQHDAAEHQRLSAQVVTRLAAQRRLAALTLEMAERGRSTVGLAPDAGEPQVREALAWDERGWPWAAYGPIAMAAVRAGVPVYGANLPRTLMREAMRDETIDARVAPPVRERLAADVKEGHCGLLPDSQLPGMTRIQIARDAAMAETALAQVQPGRVVVLVAGQNHVDALRGVPQQLQRAVPPVTVRTVRLAAGALRAEQSEGFDETWPTPALRPVDHCAGLAEKLGPAR
jgi:uncharacterized iron-regulated protein